MPVVEPLPPGHAVELALPWRLEVGHPLVVVALERDGVELGALLGPEVGRAGRAGVDVARAVATGGTNALGLEIITVCICG